MLRPQLSRCVYKLKEIILLSYFRVFGPPKIVQSDNGGEFLGETDIFLERLGVKHIRGRPYHPQSQGKCERSHGTWKEKIRFDLLQNENGM